MPVDLLNQRQMRQGLDNSKRADAARTAASNDVKWNEQGGAPAGYDDSFLRRARDLHYEYGYGGSSGAEISALRARSNQLRGLTAAEEKAPEILANQKAELERSAGASMESGVRNTRKAYSNRGLLYGGLREGGEQDVRGSVASTLASGLSDANKESANLRTSYKEAKANLGLRSQAQSLERANQVFDTAMRNQVTRLQALQALGQGAGYAAGAYYGSQQSPQTTRQPTSQTGSYFGANYNQPTENFWSQNPYEK